MVQTKRNQEKVVFTKLCFHGSAKIQWKIKVCVMENKGSVAKMIEMKIAERINILLEHKSIDYLDHFKLYMWTKCTCAHVHIYMYIWTKAHSCAKHETFHICMHMDTSVVLMSTNAPRHMCICKYRYVH